MAAGLHHSIRHPLRVAVDGRTAAETILSDELAASVAVEVDYHSSFDRQLSSAEVERYASRYSASYYGARDLSAIANLLLIPLGHRQSPVSNRFIRPEKDQPIAQKPLLALTTQF
jgi:hypothetical protein